MACGSANIGSPDILGKSITLDRQSYTVIGILPKGTNYSISPPTSSSPWGPGPASSPTIAPGTPASSPLHGLKPGVPLAKARAEMSTIASRL